MKFRKDADWVIVVGECSGFCYMIALFIDTFCGSAFGAVANPAKGKKMPKGGNLHIHTMAAVKAENFVNMLIKKFPNNVGVMWVI